MHSPADSAGGKSRRSARPRRRLLRRGPPVTPLAPAAKGKSQVLAGKRRARRAALAPLDISQAYVAFPPALSASDLKSALRLPIRPLKGAPWWSRPPAALFLCVPRPRRCARAAARPVLGPPRPGTPRPPESRPPASSWRLSCRSRCSGSASDASLACAPSPAATAAATKGEVVTGRAAASSLVARAGGGRDQPPVSGRFSPGWCAAGRRCSSRSCSRRRWRGVSPPRRARRAGSGSRAAAEARAPRPPRARHGEAGGRDSGGGQPAGSAPRSRARLT